MLESPKISIVVLTYNQSLTIERTLNSILNQQTKYSFELIIGEDSSKDNTRDICLQYMERFPDKVRLLPSAPNKGLLKNFRDAISACRGEYICQCAGDDWWHNPYKLQLEIEYMEKNPICGMVHSDVDLYNAVTGRTLHNINKRQHRAIPTGYYAPFLLTEIIPIYTPTPCYRKNLIEKVNFDEFLEQGFMMEDLPMWLEMAKYAIFHYIDESLATYTSAPDSACRPDSLEKHLKFEENVTKVQLYYRRKYYSEIDKQEILKADNKRKMTVFRRFKKYRQAFECYRKIDFGNSWLRKISRSNYFLYRLFVGMKEILNRL